MKFTDLFIHHTIEELLVSKNNFVRFEFGILGEMLSVETGCILH